MEKRFIYDGVVSGKKVDSWTCPIVETVVDGKKKQEPDTAVAAARWKKTYTRENGRSGIKSEKPANETF